jgi:hypothetical protein
MQKIKSFWLSVGDFSGVLFKLEILLVFLCGKKSGAPVDPADAIPSKIAEAAQNHISHY